MKTTMSALAIVGVCLCASAASAQGLFSNIPPGPFAPTGTYTDVGPGDWLSVQFTAWGPAVPDFVQLVVDPAGHAETIQVTVSLARDAAGIPGEVIATTTGTFPPGRIGFDFLFEQVGSISGTHHIVISGSTGAWRWSHVQPEGARLPGGWLAGISLLASADGVAWSAESPDSFGGIYLGGMIQCSTDIDGDGDHGTDHDIEVFFRCMAGDCFGACFPTIPDFNMDGDWGTDEDIEAFFRALGGGSCL